MWFVGEVINITKKYHCWVVVYHYLLGDWCAIPYVDGMRPKSLKWYYIGRSEPYADGTLSIRTYNGKCLTPPPPHNLVSPRETAIYMMYLLLRHIFVSLTPYQHPK